MRYQDTTTIPHEAMQPGPPARPSAARQVWYIVVLASGASAVLLVAGAMGAGAAGYRLEEAKTVLLGLATTPWATAGVILLYAVYRRSVWALEDATRRDLDGDGTIGVTARPASDSVHIEIARRDENGRVQQWQFLDVDVDADRLRQFARAVATEERSLAVAAWTGRSGLFSRGEYDSLMQSLMRAGLVSNGVGNTPRGLTCAGKAVLKRLAQ